jgi:hypothetical protein
MTKFKNVIGTVTVSKWSKTSNEWLAYSQCEDYFLLDFQEIARQNEVMVEDATYLYQFESTGEDNIQTYFASNEYCL